MVAFVILAGFFIHFNQNNTNALIKIQQKTEKEQRLPRIRHNVPESPAQARPAEGLSLLIGQNVAELKKEYGEPQRIDKTVFGYQWFIYNLDGTRYFQAGVENDRVVTVFAVGGALDVVPFEIGQPIEEIFNVESVDSTVNINLNESSYRFELSETDINTRPLIKLGNIYAQLYIDKFTGNLLAVRFADPETLVKQHPYSLKYSGTLPETPIPPKAIWQDVNNGAEREIFDITNSIRARNHVQPLAWDPKTAKVAYGHSKDMYRQKYFSHTSRKYGPLKERLKTVNVKYKKAGENIAANYADGPSVVARWLNSKTPRKTLLSKDFTKLGVGVYRKYYTQVFVK